MNTVNIDAVKDFNQNGYKDTTFAAELISEINNIEQEFKDQDKAGIFPVEVFPEWACSYIKGISETLNVPLEYVGCSVLSAVSTAVGKSSALVPKNGWIEYAAFYFILVGNTGMGKSHCTDRAFMPLDNLDRRYLQQYKAKRKEYDIKVLTTKKENQAELLNLEPPKRQQICLSDFTPESIDQQLADNERSCAVKVGEFASFYNSLGGYSKTDSSSKYLDYYNSKSKPVNRIKSPIPLFIETPHLNIIGETQPVILPSIFPKDKQLNGWLGRLLFAFPYDTTKKPFNESSFDEELQDQYNQRIDKLISELAIHTDEWGRVVPRKYKWTTEAKDYFIRWQLENTNEFNDCPSPVKAAVITKFDNHFMRLSLVLQLMDDHVCYTVGLNAVKGAAKLCEYFKQSAFRVLDIISGKNKTSTLSGKHKILYDALPGGIFTTAAADEIARSLSDSSGQVFNKKFVYRLLKEDDFFVDKGYGLWEKKK